MYFDSNGNYIGTEKPPGSTATQVGTTSSIIGGGVVDNVAVIQSSSSPRPTSSGSTSPRPTSSGSTSPGPTSSGSTSPGPTSSGSTSPGPTSSGSTPDTTQCIPRSCPCTYYKCENYCCREFSGTYDCNCGTWNECVSTCSPGAPSFSFSLYPNRLFTNQAFYLSFRLTSPGGDYQCSHKLSCRASGQYLGANCPNNIPQRDKLYICQNEAPSNVFDPQNKLSQLFCNTEPSCSQPK
ncbi:MAG: hypothetical protein ABIK76_06220, partial [candidate division WOR-3 bacterium]